MWLNSRVQNGLFRYWALPCHLWSMRNWLRWVPVFFSKSELVYILREPNIPTLWLVQLCLLFWLDQMLACCSTLSSPPIHFPFAIARTAAYIKTPVMLYDRLETINVSQSHVVSSKIAPPSIYTFCLDGIQMVSCWHAVPHFTFWSI